MKQNKTITTTLFISIMMLYSGYVFTNGNSPGGGYSDAPGESNCGSCHATPLSSGSIWNNITLTSSVPFSSFIGGNTYSLTLSFSDVNSTKYGFQLTALSNGATASSSTIGTFSVPASNSEVQLHSGYMTGREAVAHTSSGTAAPSNSKSWTFDWTAPTTVSSSSIVFYVSVNSTNNDNSSGGDQPYVKTFAATVLPVKWLNFSYNIENNFVVLNWKTASEINNNYFDIETSIDNKKWKSVQIIKGNGNSNHVSSYKYRLNLNEKSVQYYRLKQVDFDGNYEYSKVITVNHSNTNNFFTWNELEHTLVFELNDTEKEVSIYNLKGEIKQNRKLGSQDTYLSLNDLSKGLYLVKVNCNGIDLVKKIIVN